MRVHYTAMAVYSVAIVLILSQAPAPEPGPLSLFPSLTYASYAGPLTFMVLGLLALQYGLLTGIEVSLMTGPALTGTACAIVAVHHYPVTLRLVLIVCALSAAYPVGGIVATIVMRWTRRLFLIRFCASIFLGWEATRLAAYSSTALLSGHYSHTWDAFGPEVLLGLILAVPYTLIGCGLYFAKTRMDDIVGD